MTTLAEVIARRRAEAFPVPIVVIRMTRDQHESAMLAGSPAEREWLETGIKTGQLVVTDSAKDDTSPGTTRTDVP